MKSVERSVLVLAVLLSTGSRVLASTVCFAFDDKSALAGSNEDWADPNTQVWFVPATNDTYGIVYFGFGKGEYPEGGVSSRKLKIPDGGITKINPKDLYGMPQGGINEKGLFFDGAATDVIQAPPARGKKPYDGRLEDLILRKCATVEEALKLLDTYAFNLSQGQWMFADRTGDSFIVEAGDVIVRKKAAGFDPPMLVTPQQLCGRMVRGKKVRGRSPYSCVLCFFLATSEFSVLSWRSMKLH